jgi:rod shape-determining protein MreC
MDKKVRRRRAVLGLLLAASLLLLTAYFGESAAGPFHSIQRGAFAVFSPVQDGASKVLKPARDAVGWFGDTLDARAQRDKLQKERDALLKRVVGADAAIAENKQLRALVGLDGRSGVSQYKPVTARVIGRSPTVWYSTLEVDKGSSDGVRVNQPVVGGAGLVGRVTTVTRGSSVVTLLTDHTSGVSAKVLDADGDYGSVVPEVGNPGKLLIQTLPPRAPVQAGDPVVTAGTRSQEFPSLFPPNIPIGTITRVAPGELALSQQAHLTPASDLRHLDVVQVLTAPHGGTALRADTTP